MVSVLQVVVLSGTAGSTGAAPGMSVVKGNVNVLPRRIGIVVICIDLTEVTHEVLSYPSETVSSTVEN